ncbi:MAG: transglycosylase SLT domain-containing protein [Bacteroides sp.]|nr:transglycosylase SLT domain-containing protein [Bacteroides sp.]
MKRLLNTLLTGCLALSASAALSILDIKYSITDDNVIPPESFETLTRAMEENFYIKNYTDRSATLPDTAFANVGTPEEYADLLSRLPAEIELPYNAIVGRFIDMYLTKRRSLVSDMVALHNYYGNIFVEELTKERMPLELQYLPVIESALNPNAVSRAGATGLWQFMPATANGLGMEVNSLVDQRRDPRKSSAAAAKYLKQLYEAYGDWSLAIAAYNCGPGNVNKALRRAGGGKKDFWEIYNYLPSETRGYLPAFIAANFVMNYFDRYGVRPTIVKKQLVTDTVQVSQRVHFNQIAEVLNIPVEEIRMLNPQFRKDIIPGNNHPYALVLPSQQCLSYIMSQDAILSLDADLYSRRVYVEPGQQRMQKADSTLLTDHIVKTTHVVKRGENIRDIAKKYGVSATDIKKWNNLTRGKVKVGDELKIEYMEQGIRPEALAAINAAENRADTTAAAAQSAKQKEATAVAKTQETAATRKNTASTAAATETAKKKAEPKKTETKKQTQPKAASTYTIVSGDNLYRISKKTGVSVADLQSANGLTASSILHPGQKIKIPAKSAAKSSTGGAKTTKKSTKRRR